MTLRERLEALAADWATRQYATPYSRESMEAQGCARGKDIAFHDAAAELRAVLAEYHSQEVTALSEDERMRLFASYYR